MTVGPAFVVSGFVVSALTAAGRIVSGGGGDCDCWAKQRPGTTETSQSERITNTYPQIASVFRWRTLWRRALLRRSRRQARQRYGRGRFRRRLRRIAAVALSRRVGQGEVDTRLVQLELVMRA